MNVSSFPIQFIVNNLIQIWMGQRDVVTVWINQMSKIKSITNIHKDGSFSVSISKSHIRIQIAF